MKAYISGVEMFLRCYCDQLPVNQRTAEWFILRQNKIDSITCRLPFQKTSRHTRGSALSGQCFWHWAHFRLHRCSNVNVVLEEALYWRDDWMRFLRSLYSRKNLGFWIPTVWSCCLENSMERSRHHLTFLISSTWGTWHWRGTYHSNVRTPVASCTAFALSKSRQLCLSDPANSRSTRHCTKWYSCATTGTIFRRWSRVTTQHNYFTRWFLLHQLGTLRLQTGVWCIIYLPFFRRPYLHQ